MTLDAAAGTVKASSKDANISSTNKMVLDGGTLAQIGAADVEINQS